VTITDRSPAKTGWRGLDPDLHFQALGDRQERGDPLDDLLSRPIQVLVRRRTAHEHEQGRAERGRLLESPHVVLMPGRHLGFRGRRKETSSTQAGDSEASVADEPGRGLEPKLVDLVPPD